MATIEPQTGKRYLSRAAGASFIGLSARALDKLIAAGTIPAIHPTPRRVLLDIEDLTTFMESGKSRAARGN